MAGEAFLAGPNAGGNLCDIPTGLKKYIYIQANKKKKLWRVVGNVSEAGDK